MGESNCKWNNWQRINLQNIQAPYAPQAQYQKNKQPKQTVLQRHTDSQQIHEKTFNLIHYRRNANQNYNEVITSHQSEWPLSKNLETIHAVENVEKR